MTGNPILNTRGEQVGVRVFYQGSWRGLELFMAFYPAPDLDRYLVRGEATIIGNQECLSVNEGDMLVLQEWDLVGIPKGQERPRKPKKTKVL